MDEEQMRELVVGFDKLAEEPKQKYYVRLKAEFKRVSPKRKDPTGKEYKRLKEIADEVHYGSADAPLSGIALARANKEREDQALREKTVHFSSKIDEHLFQGEKSGKSHTGLHSLNVLNGEEPGPVVEVIEGSETSFFSAWVTLPGQSERKASSFFPTAWSKDKVKKAISDAFIDHRLHRTRSASEAKPHGLSWVGRAVVDTREVVIGGIGDGDASASGIQTAFPQVNGAFKDHNKG